MYRDLATAAELGICEKCNYFPCACKSKVKASPLQDICDHCHRNKVVCNCKSRVAQAARELQAEVKKEHLSPSDLIAAKDKEVVRLYGDHDIEKIRKLVRELAEKAYRL